MSYPRFSLFYEQITDIGTVSVSFLYSSVNVVNCTLNGRMPLEAAQKAHNHVLLVGTLSSGVSERERDKEEEESGKRTQSCNLKQRHPTLKTVTTTVVVKVTEHRAVSWALLADTTIPGAVYVCMSCAFALLPLYQILCLHCFPALRSPRHHCC